MNSIHDFVGNPEHTLGLSSSQRLANDPVAVDVALRLSCAASLPIETAYTVDRKHWCRNLMFRRRSGSACVYE
jgi:hypothetical protein